MPDTLLDSTYISKETQYQAGQLLVILNQFRSEDTSGVYSFTANIPNLQRSRKIFLVFKSGQLCYANKTILDPEQFVLYLGAQLNSQNLQMGLELTKEKIQETPSIRELISLLVNMGMFSWDSVERVCLRDTLCALEQLFYYSGSYVLEEEINCDIAFSVEEKGLQWKGIFQELNSRQIKWLNLKERISSLDIIPCVDTSNLFEQELTQDFQQARTLFDGTKTISEIANEFHVDHLKFAKYCYSWNQSGWIYFKGEVTDGHDSKRPPSLSGTDDELDMSTLQTKSTVLCVDDSPIVRTMLKRALSSVYDVKLASNGIEAITILKKIDVSIVLLDVTMPDMDGYEVCRLIRKIERFKNLPIVMITAKDSVFDRVKGKLAGTDRYLTKPISPNKVLATVADYVEI